MYLNIGHLKMRVVSNDRKMYHVLMGLIKSVVLGGKSVSVINMTYHNGMNSTKNFQHPGF
jgi:hypothetical protein